MNFSSLSSSWLTVFALLLPACDMVGVAKPNQICAEIQAVCRAQEKAWNAGDIEGFMNAGYMHSDKVTFYSGGNVARGYDSMLAHYRSRYRGDGKEMGTGINAVYGVTPARHQDGCFPRPAADLQQP